MKNEVSEKTKRSVIHGIKKADMVLIAVCLLAAALLGIFFIVHRESGGEVHILCNGIELKTIDLLSASQTVSSRTDSNMATGNGYYLVTYTEDAVGIEYFTYKPELQLAEGTSYNLISVTDGKVVMESADCKDQVCVRHRPISSDRESIICLPHRLVVVVGGGDNSIDTFDEPLDGVVR